MKKYFIILFTIAITSCSNNKVPKYVIPPNDMVIIIVDIHLLDGLMSVREIQTDLVRQDTSDLYNLIFIKYGYERKDFDTSLYYYGKNINEYDRIYEDVLNKLTSMESDIKEEEVQKEGLMKQELKKENDLE